MSFDYDDCDIGCFHLCVLWNVAVLARVSMYVCM